MIQAPSLLVRITRKVKGLTSNTTKAARPVRRVYEGVSREGGKASHLAHNQDKVDSISTPATIWHVNNLDCCEHCDKEYGCSMNCNCNGQ
jgi:hypothetical protein